MSTAEFQDGDPELDDEIDAEVELDELPGLDADLEIDDPPVVNDDLEDDVDDDDADEDDTDDEDDTEDDDEDDDDEDDDDEAEESLDLLLAREKVLDEDDLGRIADESRDLSIKPALVGAGEFTCRSCYLVKRRAQMADEQRMLCFDCV